MKPVFKEFVDEGEIEAPKSGWTPIKQQTIIEDFNKDKKYSFKTLKEVLVEGGLVEEKPKEVLEENLEPVLTAYKELFIETVQVPEPVVEQSINEEVVVKPKVEESKPVSLVDAASDYITRRVKIEEADSFQQPVAPNIPNNLTDINKRVRYLEQWLAKVSMAGPGGGDANPHDQIEFLERGVRFTPTPRMMYWNSNEDCLNIEQADGSTLQVGLENYIRVYNNTANTFSNGTFIEFTGVDAQGAAPVFRSYINNANAQPLYSIGVLTTDVSSNSYGRATCLGLVRDIDTTGNAVGESWAVGDVLWANPSYPGKFTKVKPTSPNVAISVAAVTTIGATDGIILVRPAIWPRLRYGDFFSTVTQAASSPNQDVQLAISNTFITSGFTLAANSIIALDSGLYKFQTRAQITSTSSSSKSLILWYKKNGVSVPRSSVRQSIAENGGYRTITNFQLISLDAGDNVSVHFTVTDTNIFIDSPPNFGGAAEIPSIQIAVTEAAL